jgi:hypothetical protein
MKLFCEYTITSHPFATKPDYDHEHHSDHIC